jgi:rSAM/selenodomain-associated transferase 2
VSIVTSVVIPALDDAPALLANLPRIAALPGAKELIVADGGGNEAAVATAQELGARVVPARVGRGTQMNAGAAVARGERLLFLHADCWLDDGALAEVERALAVPAIGAGVFRQQIEGTRFAYRCIERAATLRTRFLRRPYGDSGLFLRRADFERVGGFPDLPLCEDLAMAKRLRPLGRIVVARSRVHLSARRWERHGIVKTTLLNWTIAGAFHAGVAPAKLYRAYYGRDLPGNVAERAARGPRGSGVRGRGMSEQHGPAGPERAAP